MILYGTRDAAMSWQEEVAREMHKLGFLLGGITHASIITKNLRTFLHGDDFATVGTRVEVAWFEDAQDKRFEIKTQCIGPAALGVGGQSVVGASNDQLQL